MNSGGLILKRLDSFTKKNVLGQNICKFLQILLAPWWYVCMRMWEILRQKRGKSCKSKDFGVVGPKLWKNVGNFASEEEKSYCNKDSWCNGTKTMERCMK